MKSKVEIFMGTVMILMVLSASIYYNSDAYYVQAAKKTNGEEDVSKSQGRNNESEKEAEKEVEKGDEAYRGYTVAIDAGHGGFDPGKVGINNALEKDINLAIALKLCQKLENHNINVVMTRTEDVDLGDKGSGNQKKSDMRNRMNIINSAKPNICISIHQNSYTSAGAKGAQVFYYSDSENGKKLAELIQASIKTQMNDGNKRVEKSNSSYYLLTKSECPTVIVECGFLSNWEEATNLGDDYYQNKLVDAICEATLEYFEAVGNSGAEYR